MKKTLGKISHASFGLGGYQGAMIGIHIELSIDEGGVSCGKHQWDKNRIECSKHAHWTELDRDRGYSDIVRYISDLLNDAKVNTIKDLVGIPVEATLSDGSLKEFRILTEVI